MVLRLSALRVLVLSLTLVAGSGAGARAYYRGEAIVTAASPECATLAYPVAVGDVFTLYFVPPIANAVSLMVFTRDLGSFRLGRLGTFTGSGDAQADLISQSLLVSQQYRTIAFENFTMKPVPSELAPFTKFVQISGKMRGFFDQTMEGCVANIRTGVNLVEAP